MYNVYKYIMCISLRSTGNCFFLEIVSKNPKNKIFNQPNQLLSQKNIPPVASYTWYQVSSYVTEMD